MATFKLNVKSQQIHKIKRQMASKDGVPTNKEQVKYANEHEGFGGWEVNVLELVASAAQLLY